MKKAKIV